MELKEILKTAIKGELEGRELYKAISERTSDAPAKEVFKKMSEEEGSHFETLKAIYNQVERKEPLAIPNLKKVAAYGAPESPIFSLEFKSRIKDKHYEMSALSIALKLEFDSFTLYGKWEKETGDKALADFFHYLSEWEKTHYDIINRQMKYLEDDYFVANDFSPF